MSLRLAGHLNLRVVHSGRLVACGYMAVMKNQMIWERSSMAAMVTIFMADSAAGVVVVPQIVKAEWRYLAISRRAVVSIVNLERRAIAKRVTSVRRRARMLRASEVSVTRHLAA